MIRKTHLYKIIFLICFWTSASLFNIFYEASILGFRSPSQDMPYDLGSTLFWGLLVAVLSSSAVAIFEVLFFNNLLRKKPFGYTLLSKTIFYLACIVVFQTIAILIIQGTGLNLSIYNGQVWQLYLREFVLSGRLVMSSLYWAFSIVIALFVLQVSDKFGQGVLVNFLRGKYHQPKQEERIFMFMDLKSSTTIAEKLGHIQYSQLIQNCFFDLTDVVTKHGAGIYQYVGDEVVLTWDSTEGLKNSDCVHTFFEYDKVIRNKSSLYKENFGLVPEFKASLNLGSVTVAEVGEIKKELAYHGDVLNTAARIQSKCNEYQSRLLVSENIKKSLPENNGFAFNFVGEVLLRGKQQPVKIYDLQK